MHVCVHRVVLISSVLFMWKLMHARHSRYHGASSDDALVLAGLLTVAGAFAHAHSCAFHLRRLHLSHNCRSHERAGSHSGAANAPRTSDAQQPSFIGADGTAVQVNMLPGAQNPLKIRSNWMRVPVGEDAEVAPSLPPSTDLQHMHDAHACSAVQAHDCMDMIESLCAMAPNLVATNLPRLEVRPPVPPVTK